MLWFAMIEPTTQGEAKYAGTPIVMVRTMLCNLTCVGYETVVLTKDMQYLLVGAILPGERILYWDGKDLKESVVLDVISKEVTEAYEYYTDVKGLTISATPEHNFFYKKNKMKPISKLVGKRILYISKDGIMKVKITGVSNKKAMRVYDLVTESEKFIANGFLVHNCSWCDTKYTWRKKDLIEGIKLSVEEAVKRVVAASKVNNSKTIMLTGGEPLIWQNSLEFQSFLRECKKLGFTIHVETNGTMVINKEMKELIDFFVISPKVTEFPERYSTANVWSYYSVPHLWKFVYDESDSNLKIREWLLKYNVDRNDDIWLMPEGVTKEKLDKGIEMIREHLYEFSRDGFRSIHITDRYQIKEGYL